MFQLQPVVGLLMAIMQLHAFNSVTHSAAATTTAAFKTNAVAKNLLSNNSKQDNLQTNSLDHKKLNDPADAHNVEISDEVTFWKDAKVPYEFDDSFTQTEKDMVLAAFKGMATRTCIKFLEYTNEEDYLYIQKENTGCWSNLGLKTGMNLFNLEPEQCLDEIGIIYNEIMHSLGFYTENNRYERDTYIRINFENVMPGMKYHFDKHKRQTPPNLEYDFASVTHFGPYEFTQNGKKTIEPLVVNENTTLMGQRKDLSAGDIEKINFFYKCDSQKITNDCPTQPQGTVKKKKNATLVHFVLNSRTLDLKFDFTGGKKEKAYLRIHDMSKEGNK